MRRYAQVIQLLPQFRGRIHPSTTRRSGPRVLATIEACNIRNYSIFLHGSLLIAYFEYHGDDYDADMKRMAADPETQRWWSIMDPMQKPLPEAPAGRRWLEIPEVFHFEGAPVKSDSR